MDGQQELHKCTHKRVTSTNITSIHPLAKSLILCRVAGGVGGLEPIPADTGREMRHTRDRSPVYHRAEIGTGNKSHSHLRVRIAN